jgi:hypothetical protein
MKNLKLMDKKSSLGTRAKLKMYTPYICALSPRTVIDRVQTATSAFADRQ